MRPIHLLALACVLVLALIGVLTLAGSESSAAPSSVAAASRTRPARTQDAATDAPDARSASEGERSAAASVASQSAPAPSPARGSRGVRLLPVTGSQRRPVAPAELWWWPEKDGDGPAQDAHFFELLRSSRVDELLESRAQRLEADAEGRFFAPDPKSSGLVVARSSGLWGYVSIDSKSDDPTYVLCEPDFTLQVRVVDGAGAPVDGVRVALRQHYHGLFFTDHGVATTDAQGHARLPHYRALIDGDWDFTARYSIAIAEPLSAEVARLIDVTAPPSEMVELVLPPVGSVELECEGAPANLRAGLEILGIGEPAAEELDERFADGRRDVTAGRVRFPFVGLGREIVPWSFDAGPLQAHDDARRLGPTRAGEEVRVRVRLGASAASRTTLLTGRLINEAGAALSEVELHLSVECESEESSEHHVIGRRSNAEGRFSAPLALRCDAPVLVNVSGRRDEGRGFSSTEWRVAIPLGEASFDLGDVRVVEAPLLAAGKVVDRSGAPVPRAEIDVFERIDRVRANGESWVEWRTHTRGARADATGAFRVWGVSPTGRVSLQARAHGRRSSPTRAHLEQTDVVLVLERDGAIAGRVLLPPLAPPDFVYVTASSRIRNLHQLAPEENWSAELDPNGEFVIEGLPPDEYELNFHHDGRDAPLETVERVVVKDHETARDERLDPLDLRGLSELFLVEVFGPDGKPVDAVFQLGHDESDGEAWENEMGGHRLILHRDGPSIWIGARDCTLQELVPAAAPTRVSLQPAPRVLVRLDEALAAQLEGLEPKVAITSPGEPAWLSRHFADEFYFEAASSTKGSLRRVGTLRAALWLNDDSSSAVEAQFLGGASVVAIAAQQELVITCDPAKLAAALEELR